MRPPSIYMLRMYNIVCGLVSGFVFCFFYFLIGNEKNNLCSRFIQCILIKGLLGVGSGARIWVYTNEINIALNKGTITELAFST